MDPRQTRPPHGPDAPPPGGGPNGAGWDWRSEFQQDQPQWRPGLPDFSPVLALLDAIRRMIPPELQEEIYALQRYGRLPIPEAVDWDPPRVAQGAAAVE